MTPGAQGPSAEGQDSPLAHDLGGVAGLLQQLGQEVLRVWDAAHDLLWRVGWRGNNVRELQAHGAGRAVQGDEGDTLPKSWRFAGLLGPSRVLVKVSQYMWGWANPAPRGAGPSRPSPGLQPPLLAHRDLWNMPPGPQGLHSSRASLMLAALPSSRAA